MGFICGGDLSGGSQRIALYIGHRATYWMDGWIYTEADLQATFRSPLPQAEPWDLGGVPRQVASSAAWSSASGYRTATRTDRGKQMRS